MLIIVGLALLLLLYALYALAPEWQPVGEHLLRRLNGGRLNAKERQDPAALEDMRRDQSAVALPSMAREAVPAHTPLDMGTPARALRLSALGKVLVVPSVALPIALAGLAFIAYALSASFMAHGFLVQSPVPYYVLLAKSWLHLSWSTGADLLGSRTADLTLFNGQTYIAFPPLPAVVLLPFIAIFGSSFWDVPFSIGLSSLNVFLLYCVLGQLEYWGVRVSLWTRAWLVTLFAFGSPIWYLTIDGSVWFEAHIVALTCILLGLVEALHPERRPLRAAWWFGLAGLARPDAWAAATFFVGLEVAIAFREHRLRGAVRSIRIFLALFIVFPLIEATYNVVRFGSVADPGYKNMQVNPMFLSDLQQYGVFSLHYLAHDLFYMFLAPPLVQGGEVMPDPSGMSLFLTMPALVYLVGAWRVRRTRLVATVAAVSSVITIIPLATYYNTGWIQFGSRFAVDFLPFLLLLVALGARGRATRLLCALVITSVVITAWGTLWFFVKYVPVRV